MHFLCGAYNIYLYIYLQMCGNVCMWVVESEMGYALASTDFMVYIPIVAIVMHCIGRRNVNAAIVAHCHRKHSLSRARFSRFSLSLSLSLSLIDMENNKRKRHKHVPFELWLFIGFASCIRRYREWEKNVRMIFIYCVYENKVVLWVIAMHYTE